MEENTCEFPFYKLRVYATALVTPTMTSKQLLSEILSVLRWEIKNLMGQFLKLEQAFVQGRRAKKYKLPSVPTSQSNINMIHH